MTDIKCCQCGEWTRGVEHLLKGGYLTVQSGFTKSAGESCDNCGHDFCENCTRTEEDETSKLNNDRIVELFKQEYPQYRNHPVSVIEDIKEFNIFRLGYYLGGADTYNEVLAKVRALFKEVKE